MPQQGTRPSTRPATQTATGTAPLAAEPKSGGSKKGLIIGGVIAALLILGGIIFALSSGGGDNNGASGSTEGPEVVTNVVTTGPPVIVVRFVGEKIEYYKLGNDEGKYVILEKDTEYKAGSPIVAVLVVVKDGVAEVILPATVSADYEITMSWDASMMATGMEADEMLYIIVSPAAAE
jgi:uncharacterized cupredoxin-like copper-binding protein